MVTVKKCLFNFHFFVIVIQTIFLHGNCLYVFPFVSASISFASLCFPSGIPPAHGACSLHEYFANRKGGFVKDTAFAHDVSVHCSPLLFFFSNDVSRVLPWTCPTSPTHSLPRQIFHGYTHKCGKAFNYTKSADHSFPKLNTVRCLTRRFLSAHGVSVSRPPSDVA